jgi:hypothetical protein
MGPEIGLGLDDDVAGESAATILHDKPCTEQFHRHPVGWPFKKAAWK